MRFTFAESMCDPSHYLPLARAADEAGWHAFSITDSICYPEVSESKYPYTPDGDRTFLEDKPFIEPFSLIPAMGAVTEKLEFTTFVVKLPIRHPVLAAKQAASVSVLTNNRFNFGVGLSPWPEDFRICGQPWAKRGKRLDEMIEIIRGLTSPEKEGDFFEYHGEHYDLESIKICPVPTKPIPIWVGGHVDLALRRAARLGDGWVHGGGEGEELEAMIEKLNRYRAEFGRERDPFRILVISFDAYTLDGVKRLEDLGVTDALIGFRNIYAGDERPLQEKIDMLSSFADTVISKAS